MDLSVTVNIVVVFSVNTYTSLNLHSVVSHAVSIINTSQLSMDFTLFSDERRLRKLFCSVADTGMLSLKQF